MQSDTLAAPALGASPPAAARRVSLYALRAAARGTGRLVSIHSPVFRRRANDQWTAAVTVRRLPPGGGPGGLVRAVANLDACYAAGPAWRLSWRLALAACAEAAALRAAFPADLDGLHVPEEPDPADAHEAPAAEAA